MRQYMIPGGSYPRTSTGEAIEMHVENGPGMLRLQNLVKKGGNGPGAAERGASGIDRTSIDARLGVVFHRM